MTKLITMLILMGWAGQISDGKVYKFYVMLNGKKVGL